MADTTDAPSSHADLDKAAEAAGHDWSAASLTIAEKQQELAAATAPKEGEPLTGESLAEMEQSDVGIADLGTPYGPRVRELAEKSVNADDPVGEAYQNQLLADSHQEEAEHKATIVEESRGADTTPSGSALLRTKGIDHDTERGEAYQREKAAVRWGGSPPEAPPAGEDA